VTAQTLLSVTLDGQALDPNAGSVQPLVRAVVISLFTWRRANPDDALPGTEKMGWWGDNFATVENDRIGSRLWLLLRAKVLPETVARAQEYAREALQWLIDDGVAARVDVLAERQGQDRVALQCTVYRAADRVPVDIRFANVWSFL
jgi:phage gp46-like protein